MATKGNNTEAINLEDQLTVTAEEHDDSWKGPTVRIFIPELESNNNGMKVDQYEHVSIANMVKEDCTYVRRGEWVDVPVPVYLQLRERYPKI